MINKKITGERNNIDTGYGETIDFNNGEFDMPEKNDSEIQNNELEASEEEKKARHEKNIAILEELYEKRNKEAGKIFDKAKDKVGESNEGIRSIRQMRGGDYAKISFGLRQELSREQANIETEISDLEYSALEVPKDLEGETASPDKFKIEIPEDIRNLERKTNELADDSMSAREALVEKFIKVSIFSIYGIKTHFADSFHEAINGKNAEDIIAYKTEKEIRHAASGFIEKGDRADFGFRAQLEVSSYKRKVRGAEVEKKFITGYTINIGGYEKKIRKNDNLRGSNFVPGSQADEIDRAKSGVRKEKVK
ncbi:MAG: hypothetical protein V1732_03855 [Patescibacteria group bacterium]